MTTLLIKKYLKKFTILFICGILFLITENCNPKLRNNEQEIPKPPIGIKVKANSGLTFTLYYYVQNKETSFDGYNVYITREATGNTSLVNIYPPYSINGGFPTLIHTGNEVNVDQPKTFTLSNFIIYNSNSVGSNNTLYIPFQNGVRYFFKITAHTNFDVESSPSNEVSAVAIQ
ncbi:MAG: hypothetical protein OEV78_10165 [Spirochaetia bacterium]|nr:hypothetical protein [Spirochaetia bacterium]